MTQISASKDRSASDSRGLQTDVPALTSTEAALGLSEVSDYLKAPAADDALVEMLIVGIQEQVEQRIGRLLARREVVAQWSEVPEHARLPYPPHGSVGTVERLDAAGSATTLVEGDDYEVRGQTRKRVVVQAPNGLRVTYQAGYQSVPAALKMQMLRDIASRYDRRENMAQGTNLTELPDPSAYDQWRVMT